MTEDFDMQMMVLIAMLIAQDNGASIPPAAWIFLGAWTLIWIISVFIHASDANE